jgi:hypothetical protein
MCRLDLVVAGVAAKGLDEAPPQLLLLRLDDEKPLLDVDAGEGGAAEKAWAS